MEKTLTQQIIKAAITVHNSLGPGLLESTYENCLAYELNEIGLFVEQQRVLPVSYKKIQLDCGYRVDLLVENKVIIEVKSVAQLHRICDAQILTYLKLSKLQIGLIINFNVRLLKEGLRRIML